MTLLSRINYKDNGKIEYRMDGNDMESHNGMYQDIRGLPFLLCGASVITPKSYGVT